MADELKPCPFCGCSMRLESNRDWHRIVGDHALECAFTDSETMVVPATKEQRDIAVSDWNARAVPAGHVLVSEGLLRRIVTPALTSSDASDRIGALEELRDLLSEQA
ncbi:Lar family restriction alleviation protein [Pseudomonas aeruginosa]|uniref:Lar family restriction alleviation protein n=1 Tax=Pseudomonas aeruginosa TaxID=287 RepID=UPI003F3BD39C